MLCFLLDPDELLDGVLPQGVARVLPLRPMAPGPTSGAVRGPEGSGDWRGGSPGTRLLRNDNTLGEISRQGLRGLP